MLTPLQEKSLVYTETVTTECEQHCRRLDNF